MLMPTGWRILRVRILGCESLGYGLVVGLDALKV